MFFQQALALYPKISGFKPVLGIFTPFSRKVLDPEPAKAQRRLR